MFKLLLKFFFHENSHGRSLLIYTIYEYQSTSVSLLDHQIHNSTFFTWWNNIFFTYVVKASVTSNMLYKVYCKSSQYSTQWHRSTHWLVSRTRCPVIGYPHMCPLSIHLPPLRTKDLPRISLTVKLSLENRSQGTALLWKTTRFKCVFL